AALDLFDLILRECLEDVFAQRLGVVLLDGLLCGQANLANRASVEVDFHESASSEPDPALNEGRRPSQGCSSNPMLRATVQSVFTLAGALLASTAAAEGTTAEDRKSGV